MVQLKVLSGKMAGAVIAARHFPFQIGRGPGVDLRLEDDGVWERHAEVSFDRERGFVLKTQASALASVNGQPLAEGLLRSGDIIEMGAAKLCFWLGETRQKSLGFREWLAWLGFALVIALQLYLIWWLTW